MRIEDKILFFERCANSCTTVRHLKGLGNLFNIINRHIDAIGYKEHNRRTELNSWLYKIGRQASVRVTKLENE